MWGGGREGERRWAVYSLSHQERWQRHSRHLMHYTCRITRCRDKKGMGEGREERTDLGALLHFNSSQMHWFGQKKKKKQKGKGTIDL